VTRPEPNRAYHDKFCQVEGWEQVRNARGQAVAHHITYKLVLTDGRILRTRISRPVNRDGYGPSLWSHILKDQLQVTEDEFWSCVLEGTVPVRIKEQPPMQAVPAEMVHLLIHKVGLPEAEVGQMSKDEALARLNQFWTEGQ
jgi:hypothetical protein